ncbi:MAG: XdhC family protein [Betaproteobacteria bacterium]|nr:XdhC family protein [Betaproteobacteria bacterium]
MKRAVLERLATGRAAKQPLSLVTRLADGAQCLWDSRHRQGELSLTPQQAAEVQSLLVAGRSAPLATSGGALFARSYAAPPRLLVVGAVHVTQFLAPMAALAGFEVVVIDPRRAFASEARFPGITLITEWPDQALAQIGLDAHSAVVTLTHDPKLDDPALVAALNSPAFYIGALGNPRTHAKRVARLSERGLGELIGRIHAPVGLDLGGRSPAEIAVSVLAQVIQIRNRGATQ